MTVDEITRIGIVGSGNMGAQIAEVGARVGRMQILMWDINEQLTQKGYETIHGNLQKFFVEKGKMSALDADDVIRRIKTTTDLSDVAKTDFVIEAVPDNMAIKQKVFQQLDAAAAPATVLATNTSYLNITDIAGVTRLPERVVGMHSFNPVSVMKLVEVARGTKTSVETVQLTRDLAVRLGKEPVVCSDASYGFIANRAYRAFRLEAARLVSERIVSPKEIDKAIKLAFNLPMGPLELGDMTGSWGIMASSEAEAMNELGTLEGKLPPLVRRMVRAGYTGGRDKQGIYAFWEQVMSE